MAKLILLDVDFECIGIVVGQQILLSWNYKNIADFNLLCALNPGKPISGGGGALKALSEGKYPQSNFKVIFLVPKLWLRVSNLFEHIEA